MRLQSSDIGRMGEGMASVHLVSMGVRMECSNYRGRFGEIDLIGWDGDTLVFYEVKTRTGCPPGISPLSSITRSKLRKIERTARQFMYERLGREVDSRLAVVTIVLHRGTGPTIEVIPVSQP